jgi:pimeloyl-ACP methyl ester carboxylesterase
MRSRFFLSNETRLHYIDAGAGDSIVFVHGFAHDATRWVRNGAVDLFASRYRVLALDCRGHGESDKPHDPAQYASMEQDVLAMLDEAGVARAHVVGYSMGGNLLGRLLVRNRERLLSATLIGATGLASHARDDERARMADAFERGDASTLVMAVRPTNEPAPDAAQLQEASARILAGNDPLALAALLRAPIVPITAQDLAAAAAAVPMLGIAGTSDPALAGLVALAATARDLQVVPIPEAGHASTFNRPELLAAIEAFIAGPEHALPPAQIETE